MSSEQDGRDIQEFERGLADALRRIDRRRDEELAQAASEETEEDRRFVAELLAGRAPGPPREQRPAAPRPARAARGARAPVRWRTAGVVAAAAAGLALLAWRPWSPEEGDAARDGPTPLLLGAHQVRSLETEGSAVGEVTRFRWTIEGGLPPGGWCVIIVHDDGLDAPRAEPLESPRLRAETWVPTAEERKHIPRSFRWEVEVRNAGGERVGSAEAFVPSSSSD